MKPGHYLRDAWKPEVMLRRARVLVEKEENWMPPGTGCGSLDNVRLCAHCALRKVARKNGGDEEYGHTRLYLLAAAAVVMGHEDPEEIWVGIDELLPTHAHVLAAFDLAIDAVEKCESEEDAIQRILEGKKL